MIVLELLVYLLEWVRRFFDKNRQLDINDQFLITWEVEKFRLFHRLGVLFFPCDRKDSLIDDYCKLEFIKSLQKLRVL
jgi:hypothetical protein